PRSTPPPGAPPAKSGAHPPTRKSPPQPNARSRPSPTPWPPPHSAAATWRWSSPMPPSRTCATPTASAWPCSTTRSRPRSWARRTCAAAWTLLGQANNLELAGKPVSKSLLSKLQAQHADLLKQQRIIAEQRVERASLDGELADAVERYRAFKNPDAA